jgi:hypothetical protein
MFSWAQGGGHVGRKVKNQCLVDSGVCREVINDIKGSDLDEIVCHCHFIHSEHTVFWSLSNEELGLCCLSDFLGDVGVEFYWNRIRNFGHCQIQSLDFLV